MKKAIGVALLLFVASVAAAADTNPPGWSAKYWASTNGVTAELSVKKHSDSYMIYTNRVSTGVLTKNVDQDAVTAFRAAQNKPVTVLMYLTPEGFLAPVNPNLQWKMPVLVPAATNATLGTADNPWPEGYFGSNSVHVGSEKLSASDVQRAKSIGKSKILKKVNGNVSVTDTDWTIISPISLDFNARGGEKVIISLIASSKVTAGETLVFSFFLDGVNLVSTTSGALVANASEDIVPVTATFITDDPFEAGAHTLDLRAKVTGGTGTIYASQTTAPLVVTLIEVQGDLE